VSDGDTSWIAVTQPSNGTGTGNYSVKFRVSPNNTHTARTGYIYVDYPPPGQFGRIRFTVYQTAAGCRLEGGAKEGEGILSISDGLLPLPHSSVFDPIRLRSQRDAVSLRR
jgi:hypothetical protein